MAEETDDLRPDFSHLVPIPEAARILSMSESYFYKNWKRLGIGVKFGHVRIDLIKVRELMDVDRAYDARKREQEEEERQREARSRSSKKGARSRRAKGKRGTKKGPRAGTPDNPYNLR